MDTHKLLHYKDEETIIETIMDTQKLLFKS